MYNSSITNQLTHIFKSSVPLQVRVWQGILISMVLSTVILSTYGYIYLSGVYSAANSMTGQVVHKRIVDKSALKKIMTTLSSKYK